MNDLIQVAMDATANEYGNRGSLQARRLHAAVLLRRAADELAHLVRSELDDAKLESAIAAALAVYPTATELRKAVTV